MSGQSSFPVTLPEDLRGRHVVHDVRAGRVGGGERGVWGPMGVGGSSGRAHPFLGAEQRGALRARGRGGGGRVG